MSACLDALNALSLLAEGMLRGPMGREIDGLKECRRLSEVRSELLGKGFIPKTLRKPLDAKRVWESFRTEGYNLGRLNSREVGTICRSPDTALLPELVRALQQRPGELERTSCLLGLVLSYFAKWGQMTHQSEVEKLIVATLEMYTRKNPILLRCREHRLLIFSGSSPKNLGRTIIEKQHAPKSLLDHFGIDVISNLGKAAMSRSVEMFASNIGYERSPAIFDAQLDYALTKLLGADVPPEAFYLGISELILHPGAAAGRSHFKLREYVNKSDRLGDPRLNQGKWGLVTREARDRFLGWIAKEYIVFFFNHVLPDNNANRRRKDFWLRFAPQLTDFQVALSSRDFWRLRATSNERELPLSARVDHETTSAFIMQFRGRSGNEIIVVEFSETGNAAHKFEAKRFESEAGTLRNQRFRFSDLKHHADENRILHHGDRWERFAFDKMAEWGIRN